MGKTKGLSLGGQCVSPPSGQELRGHPPMETPHTHFSDSSFYWGQVLPSRGGSNTAHQK